MGHRQWSRRHFGLLLAFFSSRAAHATTPDSIAWLHDYSRAHYRRVAERRPMLIFVTMESCPHCHRMLHTTYRDGWVSNEVTRAFVPALVNGTENQELVRSFGVRVYPTTFIVAPNNRLLDRIEGYVTADQLRQRLTTVSRRLAARPSNGTSR